MRTFDWDKFDVRKVAPEGELVLNSGVCKKEGSHHVRVTRVEWQVTGAV